MRRSDTSIEGIDITSDVGRWSGPRRHRVTLTADSADLKSEEREQMAAVKARVASQGPGITDTGRWAMILATFRASINYIDRATRDMAQLLVGQGLHLNQDQQCGIPVSSKTTSRTRRRRTS
jgi:hypothetical protein